MSDATPPTGGDVPAPPPPPPPTPVTPTAANPPPPAQPPASPPPPSPPVPPAGGGGDSPARRRSPVLVLVGIVAVVALIAGAVVAVTWILSDSDEEAGAGEILLEPVSSEGRNAFTASVDTQNRSGGTTTPTTQPRIPLRVPPRAAAVAAVTGVDGSRPGLYGGSNDNQTCDREQLVSFLESNPDLGRAWAAVLGIAPGAIRSYVAGLTPVILQRDTRVTNHGYENGRATPLQSVLQAGSAVLVDAFGVPRVRCECGNPLTPPVATPVTPVYTGPQWPDFTPVNIVNVTQAVEVTSFVLVNVNGGDPFVRPVGTDGAEDAPLTVDELCDLYPEDPDCAGSGGARTPATVPGQPGEPALGTGDVQVTLRWFSAADLDLAVTDPQGNRVSYGTPVAPNGGSLDVDSNSACSSASASPVENIFWPSGEAPDGVYTVEVSYFSECPGGEGPQAFTLTVLVAGAPVAVTPASFPEGGGTVTFAIDTSAGAVEAQTVVRTQEVNGELPVDGNQTLQFSKQRPVTTTTTAPTTTTTAASGQDDGGEAVAPEPPDCSQYPEGSMMRILCEHDPFSS